MQNNDDKIRLIIQPDYYKNFSCLASNCPDTCCKGWIIQVEKEAYETWKTLSSTTNTYGTEGECAPVNCLSVFPQRKDEVTYQMSLNKKGECPLLTSNGLCSVVMKYGDDKLPRICQDFPRQKNEFDGAMQRAVSVRCDPVLDLLWKQETFQYEIIDATSGAVSDNFIPESNAKSVAFPVKNLLDGFLAFGNRKDCNSKELLFDAFSSLYKMHRKLEQTMPCDAVGFRDYGQEFVTDENTKEVLSDLNSCDCPQKLLLLTGKYSSDELLHMYHDMMYDAMQSFFDSPVFGPDFHELFHQSRDLMSKIDPQVWSSYISGAYFSKDIERKLKLLILEELFTSVLSPDVEDYESILVRLQWLIVQYLVIRYILFLDIYNGKTIDNVRLKYRITRLFRVTELPDILKIAFFDSSFLNWLWTPEKVQQLLDNI